jgi:hypothetical protein
MRSREMRTIGLALLLLAGTVVMRPGPGSAEAERNTFERSNVSLKPRFLMTPIPQMTPPALGTNATFANDNQNQELAQSQQSAHKPRRKPQELGKPTGGCARGQCLTWNLWAEEADAGHDADYVPKDWLMTGGKYRIAIELAPFAYRRGGKKIPGAVPSSTAFTGRITEMLQPKWLEGRKNNAWATILLLPDPAYFEAPASSNDRKREIRVNLEKVRWATQGHLGEGPGDTFSGWHNGYGRAVVLSDSDEDKDSRTLFPVTVSDREGWAQIGVSIWVADKTSSGEKLKPVDEFSVPLCVASSEQSVKQNCKSPVPSSAVFRGINAFRPVAENARMPDAAIHFIDMGGPPVYGIFRRNDQPNSEFKVWTIHRSFGELVTQLEELRGQITESVLKLAGAKREEQLRNEGISMYNALFPDTTDGRAARAEFEAFAVPRLKVTQNPARPMSIFVRMVGGNLSMNLLPLSFLALPTSANTSELLGLHFKIEQPLEVQSYERSNQCIARWMTVLPNEKTAGSVRPSLSDLRSGIESWPTNWSSTRVEDDSGMHRFRAFVKGRGPVDATALVIMSHQSKNAVWFDDGQTVNSAEVKVKFDQPSLVILDGCDTAKPESWGFIGQFNRNGVTTAIATATEISPLLAADFMSCLTTALETGKSEAGDTYMGTLKCLEADDKGWGSTALTFLLLGNSNLELCAPTASSAPAEQSK